jgi:hypothetical protein
LYYEFVLQWLNGGVKSFTTGGRIHLRGAKVIHLNNAKTARCIIRCSYVRVWVMVTGWRESKRDKRDREK